MCDSILLAPNPASGTPGFLAKNSDRRAFECQPFVQHPAAHHPEGARVRCTHIEIPEVRSTYRVMGASPWWCWGFEHGVNEHGLAIGNHATWSREPVEAEPGLLGMDLLRLALERARTAREAIDVIGALLARYGQGGSGFGPVDEPGYQNSFALVDRREAWVLETTARGFAAQPVTRTSLSNCVSLGAGWTITSEGFEQKARDEGWWSGRDRLDVAAAYAHPQFPRFIWEARLGRSRAVLAERSPEMIASVEGLADVLRDHGAAGPLPPTGLAADDPDHYSICNHAEPASHTTASMIAPIDPDPARPRAVWVAFGAPCTGVYLPVYIEGVLPAQAAAGGEKSPDVEAQPGVESAWWIFKALQQAAAQDFAHSLPVIEEGLRPFEAELRERAEKIEVEARERVAAGERASAGALLTDFMQGVFEEAIDRARALTRRLARAVAASRERNRH